MKKVIYTCIVGGYDPLRQPEAVDAGFDYICFTDDAALARSPRQGVWQILPIPHFVSNDWNSTVQSRFVKLQPHKVLPGYDCSIWMDPNITITGQGFYDCVNAAIDKGELIAQVEHLKCDCVYEDIANCYRNLRIGFCKGLDMSRKLEKAGFPHHFGLMENNIILRRHNDPEVIAISDEWWKRFLAGPHRDQFSLMPLYWEKGLKPGLLLGKGLNSRNVDFLKYEPHPGLQNRDKAKGLSRLPLKVRWTFRKYMSKLL